MTLRDDATAVLKEFADIRDAKRVLNDDFGVTTIMSARPTQRRIIIAALKSELRRQQR